jgi:S-DNA-T family DNA segregation ATPase FtsK/SpoIIIE
LDLIGLVLVALSLFTFVNLLSSRQSMLGGAWLNLLQAIFGWGMFVIPITLLALGLWLLFRTFGDRLPRLEVEQLLGVGLLYLALLMIMHGLIGVQGFDEGMEQARLGRGGGAVGAALLALLIGALGVGGTAVTIAAWVLIGMTFTIGLSVPELIGRTLSMG